MTDTKILLVEDDDVDVMAFKRAFRRAELNYPLQVAHNGVEALDILKGRGGQTPLELPFIIVLDLNMPLMNGLEFLETLRSEEDIRSSVVFILTTSAADEDIEAAYSHNVAGYLIKDNLGSGMHRMAELLSCYKSTVVLPG